MKVAIMQPYFLPYIGYFQLINAVDKFVVYDNIEYTKKGWINRNRILVNDRDEYITLPLKKDSDYLQVSQRYLADSYNDEKDKILRRIKESYRKAPFFIEAVDLVSDILSCKETNLFYFIWNSLLRISAYFDIKTELVISSTIPFDNKLKGESKVISICKAINTIDYINPIGGTELYNHQNFADNGLRLHFLKSKPFMYRQFDNEFVSQLSILDIIMFNSKEKIKVFLSEGYELLQPFNNEF